MRLFGRRSPCFLIDSQAVSASSNTVFNNVSRIHDADIEIAIRFLGSCMRMPLYQKVSAPSAICHACAELSGAERPLKARCRNHLLISKKAAGAADSAYFHAQ